MSDLIDRQVAIAQIESYFGDLPIQGRYDILQIIKTIPSADVPDKNVGDLIDRQAAIKMCREPRMRNADCSDFEMEIMMLPSAQPRWIPVTERLPKYGIDVLTVDGYGEYEINHIIDEEDGEWYWEPVTAWMPIPESWKGEEE